MAKKPDSATPSAEQEALVKGKTPRNAIMSIGILAAVVIGGLGFYYQLQATNKAEEDARIKKATALKSSTEAPTAANNNDIDQMIRQQREAAASEAAARAASEAAAPKPAVKPMLTGSDFQEEVKGSGTDTRRLALIGPRSSLESTRPLNATLPLAQLVKALVPQGWTGSAQKDIDLTASTSFGTRDGENWMQSLDRLVAASELYADVDFNSHHVALRRSAPQSVAVNYVAPVSQVAGSPVAASSSVTPGADPIADIAKKADAEAPAASGSVLAAKLGAVAIRDGDDSHIQIKFSAKPTAELKVTGQDGKSLRPKWDEATDVVTFNRAERFTISNGADKVEVARVAGTVYEFDTANKAALQSVFDENGSTFFKFADTVGKVTVADVAHMGSGEQKGRYFKFNGTADQFIVNADGNVVNVLRKHDVRFFDRPAS